jgi:hypothetical protein
MADDFAGLKVAINTFLDAVPLDKAIVHLREEDAQLLKQLTLLFRQKAVAAGLTGI